MNKKPLITIITITYNAEKYLENTIKSVVNQDYENIEYIIIDGESKDTTIDIIKEYESQISYWCSEPDNGIYDAMNKGIEKASGEWINFMNAGDSFVSPNILSKMIDNLNNKEVEIITGDRYSIFENSSEKILDKALRINGILNGWMPSCHQSMLIKTPLMKKYKYSLDYNYVADHDFIFKCFFIEKVKFQFLNFPIANYLRDGFSDNNNFKALIELLYLHTKYKELSKDIQNGIAYNHLTSKFPSSRSNYNFSVKFNKIYDLYLETIRKNEKIILYGNGKITKTFLNISKENIIAIVDKYDRQNKNNGIEVLSLTSLSQNSFNKIIITVLGREKEIINELKTIYNVPSEKIIILD